MYIYSVMDYVTTSFVRDSQSKLFCAHWKFLSLINLKQKTMEIHFKLIQ